MHRAGGRYSCVRRFVEAAGPGALRTARHHSRPGSYLLRADVQLSVENPSRTLGWNSSPDVNCLCPPLLAGWRPNSLVLHSIRLPRPHRWSREHRLSDRACPPTRPEKWNARHHRRDQHACAVAAVMRREIRCRTARAYPSRHYATTAWRRRCRSLCPSACGVPCWHPEDRWLRDRLGSRIPLFALFWNVFRPRLVSDGGASAPLSSSENRNPSDGRKTRPARRTERRLALAR